MPEEGIEETKWTVFFLYFAGVFPERIGLSRTEVVVRSFNVGSI